VRVCVSALLVTTKPGIGLAGVGRHMLHVLDQICSQNHGTTYEIFIDNQVELKQEWQNCPWVNWHCIPIISKYDRILWSHWRIALKARQLKCQVLFVLFNDIPFKCSIPIVSVVHDAFPRTHGYWFPSRKRKILDTLTNLACKKSKKVITVSECSKKSLAKAYNVPRDRFVVVYNGPGNQVNHCTMPSGGLISAASGRYIFTVSTLEPRKNLDGLIKGFEILKREKQFEDVSLIVAGAKGWMESDLLEQVERSACKSDIHFLGYVTEELLHSYLVGADTFALVSHVEGFGIPVLEAMIAGTPIVTSRSSSLPEVAGEFANYCEPSIHADIAIALHKSLTNRKEAMKLAEGAKIRAQDFSWESAYEKIHDVLSYCASMD
jgi:glycosyltransferase involved in cell wall biosynthesis